jgi:hypothetical protein
MVLKKDVSHPRVHGRLAGGRSVALTAGLLLAAMAAAGSETPDLRLLSLDPWCSRKADKLSRELGPAQPLKLEGLRNDCLVGAVGVQADHALDVTVSLAGPEELKQAASLAVVGEVPGPARDGKPTWWLDPVIADPQKLGDLSKDVRNWACIRDFRRLHLAPGEPVMLWLTIKTHGLPPGLWQGRMLVEQSPGSHSAMPLEVRVGAVELPAENPIIGFSFTSFRERRDLARLALEYGINGCSHYDDWDMCRQLGFKFFRFNLPHANFKGADMDVKDEEVAKQDLEPIQEAVMRLKLKPEEWGIEVFDEPFDKNAWAAVAWMVRVRRLWPEARFWCNPGYSEVHHNFATVPGTIDPLKPYVNTWCPYIKYLEPSSSEVLAALRATGQPLWYYAINYNHSRPANGGRWMPWLAWKNHLNGWALYSLEAWGKGNPWRDQTCARLYPGNTPSLWLEGLRQGVQDYKRLWLLARKGVPGTQLDRLADRVISFPDHISAGLKGEECAAARRELDRMLLEPARERP